MTRDTRRGRSAQEIAERREQADQRRHAERRGQREQPWREARSQVLRTLVGPTRAACRLYVIAHRIIPWPRPTVRRRLIGACWRECFTKALATRVAAWLSALGGAVREAFAATPPCYDLSR